MKIHWMRMEEGEELFRAVMTGATGSSAESDIACNNVNRQTMCVCIR